MVRPFRSRVPNQSGDKLQHLKSRDTRASHYHSYLLARACRGSRASSLQAVLCRLRIHGQHPVSLSWSPQLCRRPSTVFPPETSRILSIGEPDPRRPCHCHGDLLLRFGEHLSEQAPQPRSKQLTEVRQEMPSILTIVPLLWNSAGLSHNLKPTGQDEYSVKVLC